MNHEKYPVYYKGHPRLFIKRIPIFWWTRKWVHTRFILRELTSLAVAYYVVTLLLWVNSIKKGPEAYSAYMEWLSSPLAVILNSIAVIFLIFHSITWFNLAPKAMVIKLGKNKVPGIVIKGLNYFGWIVVSIAIGWIILN